jgi:uncharacterized integral membrane protein (TIGR00698 family)
LEFKITITRNFPGLALIAGFVAIAFQVNSYQPAVSPLALCVLFGFLASNLASWPNWAESGTKLASKRIMRIGVALLGFQLSVEALQQIGLKGVLTVLAVVIFTIFGILFLSKLFGMTGDLGLLIGVGFGVCGATAVAAIRPQTKATQEETSYAIALISLCGTLSIVVLPLIGHVLNLSTQTFGAWAGAAVHDVGQVIATASVWDQDAIAAAIVVKLARVSMLAPIVLILSIRHRKYLRSINKSEEKSEKVPLIPLFVIGFIAVAIFHNTVDIPTGTTANFVLLSKWLLGAGLVALGANVKWNNIKKIGAKPMLMGMLAWLIVAGVALFAVNLTGI